MNCLCFVLFIEDCLPGTHIEVINNEVTCPSCSRGYYQPDSSQDDCIKCSGTGLTTVNEGSISSKQCVSKYLISNISSKQPELSQDDCIKCPGTGLTTVYEGIISSKYVSKYL